MGERFGMVAIWFVLPMERTITVRIMYSKQFLCDRAHSSPNQMVTMSSRTCKLHVDDVVAVRSGSAGRQPQMKDYVSRDERILPSRKRPLDASASSTNDRAETADSSTTKGTGWGAVTLILLGATLAGTIGKELGGELGSATSQRIHAQRIEDSLSQAAIQMNRYGPRVIDSATRFDRASAGPGRVFRYDYTVLGAASRAMNQAQLQSFMASAIRSGYCGAPSMKAWRTNGVRVVYSYVDENGRAIGQISMRPGDC
jgi:hypothetical protein